jgi:hypothetical protein
MIDVTKVLGVGQLCYGALQKKPQGVGVTYTFRRCREWAEIRSALQDTNTEVFGL